MKKKIRAIILAAGKGTRMKSETPKVLHTLCGKPMIQHVIDAVRSSGVKDEICVIGHKADLVRKYLGGAKTVVQEKLLGSGDALNRTRKLLKDFNGDILVLCGDAPLVKRETLKRLIDTHSGEGNSCTLLTAIAPNPTGYGRIVRDDRGKITGIIEETEASVYEKTIEEINVGTYCFGGSDIFSFLSELRNNNKKGEYFLTDVISLIYSKNLKIGSVETDDYNEAIGVNSRQDLSIAEEILRGRITATLMLQGVTIKDPGSVYIEEGVEIGKDTTIYPNTIIERNVKIGERCSIGPFARIRPGCELRSGVEIGNFVELVRTEVGDGSKVKHHTYLGDTVVGRNVNIGAGTITANYDGKKKYITKINDGAFIGSGTILVAPIKVGKNAVTGAGAVVVKNHDVKPGTVVAGIPAREMKNKKRERKR